MKKLLCLLLALVLVLGSLSGCNSAETETVSKTEKIYLVASETYTASDGSGFKIDYTYDDNGNVLERITCANSEQTVDPLYNAYSYEYTFDKKGNILKSTCRQNDGDVTYNTYTYDEKGNQTEYTRVQENIELEDRFTYTYDEADILREEVWHRNGEIRCRDIYDEKGNHLAKILYDNGIPCFSYTCTYSENGDPLVSIYYDDGKESSRHCYTYDENGNVVEEVECRQGKESIRYTYLYDDSGNLLRKDGYNSNGDLLSRDTYTYDQDGCLTEIESYDGSSVAVYEYTYRAFVVSAAQADRLNASDQYLLR